VGEREDDAGDDPRPREREDDAPKRRNAGGAEGRGRIEERPVDGRERRGERLDREREAVEDRRDEEPLEGEGEACAEEGLDGPPDRAARAEQEEDVEAEDGRGEDDREGDDRFDERLPPRAREGEPRPEGQAEGQEDRRRGGRELQAEEEGREVEAQGSPPARALRAWAGRLTWPGLSGPAGSVRAADDSG
jgi:hypothetical protein